ncbi:MAG: hypothetical protein P9M03_00560, partial [Candidatus Theseobacter exili]|nr:hypothetical protein [Candidatus Theseobacter exili]
LQKTKLHVECKAVLKSLKNHWDGLIVFVKHPVIPMDNNESLCASLENAQESCRTLLQDSAIRISA